MLLIVRLNKVLQDCTRLEYVQFFTITEGGISDGRDTAIGVDSEEPWLLLDSSGDVDFLNCVGEAELLKSYGDLDAVGRLSSVECNCR